jgi:muramidase (phage lysozyme)
MPLIPEYSKQSQLQIPGGTPLASRPVEQNPIGRDVSEAGNELMQGAHGLSQMEAHESAMFTAKTAAQLSIADNKAYAEAQNSAAPDAKDFSHQQEARIRDSVETAAADAPNDRARQDFIRHMQPWIASRVDVAQHWEVNTQRFATADTLTKATSDAATGVFTSDVPGRELAAKNAIAQQSMAIDQAALTPEEKTKAKQSLLAAVVNAAVKADTRDRPSAAEGYLLSHRSMATAPEDYLNSLRQIESGGRNIGSSTSSAFGPYQITSGTWADLAKAHPELGLTAQDRFDPMMQHKAMQAKVSDDSEALKKAGFQPSYTNLYMEHFLGGGVAPKFLAALKENPDIDARKLVPDSYTRANPSLFNGRSAGELYTLFANKFGSDTENPRPKAPEYYGLLTASERENLYNTAKSAAQQHNTVKEAQFSQQAQDTISKAQTIGTNGPMTEAQFVQTYGAERGAYLYSEYAVNHTAAVQSYKVQGMTPAESLDYVNSLKPDVATPNYESKYKTFTALYDQVSKQTKAVQTDSPAYLVDPSRANKAVATAYEAMRQGMSPDKVRDYASALDSEQARMGIAPADRKLVPKQYAAEITGQIDNLLRQPQGPQQALERLNAYKANWGEYWPRIYPELKEHLSPVAQVALSGIDPHVAQTIISVADKSAEQLSKDTLNVDERKTLGDKTVAQFEEFAHSVGASVDGIKDVNIYAEQARKLAVIYRMQGMGVGDATEKAYKDLIGSRYVFDNNVRIPKAAYFPELHNELYNALRNIGDAKPQLARTDQDGVSSTVSVPNPFSTPPADGTAPQASAAPKPPQQRLPEEFVKNRTVSYLQRNGTWMTEPGDRGVLLMVNGKPYKNENGGTILLPWEELRRSADVTKTQPPSGFWHDIYTGGQ